MSKRAREKPRLAVVSLEFTYSPFSGNGVLARSLVKGLLKCGHPVDVICCQPSTAHAGKDHAIDAPEVSQQQAGALCVHPIQLSDSYGWKRLDKSSGWQQFVAGARDWAKTLETADKLPHAVIAIDWSGGAACVAMLNEWTGRAGCASRMLYINFRVYKAGLATAGDDVANWYDEHECHVLARAQHALALSARDAASLRALLPDGAATPRIDIFLPCLRGDMEALARRQAAADGDGTSAASASFARHLPPAAAHALLEACDGSTAAAAAAAADSMAIARGGPCGVPRGVPCGVPARRFVSCVVRASVEKNPQRFAALLEETSFAAALHARGLTPLISCCGPTASELQARVRAAAPSAVVLETFLGADALAALFEHTALNVHPCLYDAYGMSVVEAAAFGAPSAVQGGGEVGATALLGGDGCVEIDYAAPITDVCAALLAALDDAPALVETARVARTRALSWGEEAAGQQLSSTIERVIEL